MRKEVAMRCKTLIISVVCLLVLISLPSASITQTRDPGKIYKVAILPFLIHSQENLDYLRDGMYDVLSSRLTADGRIEIVERNTVERTLYEERPMRLDEEVAKRVGMRVGADYAVLGSVTKIGNFISLDARLISISEEKPPLGVYTQTKGIDDLMAKIGDFAEEIGNKVVGRRPSMARPGGSGAGQAARPGIIRTDPGSLGFKKSQTFPFEIKGLDIGDVNGDGKNEIVAIDKNNVYIFKYDGEKLTLLQKIEEDYTHNFLTLDAADVNRNGYAEIVVTSVVEDNLRSFILEYEEGKFRRITQKADWYYRVIRHPKEGLMLLGQRMGSDGFPAGTIYRLVWKKNAYDRGPKMPFPPGTRLSGLALVDFRGDGKAEIIAYDTEDRLNIISDNGKTVWRSDRFGGTNNSYENYKKLEEPYSPRDHIPSRVYIPPRIVVRDLDGDGIPEVIVSRNDFGSGVILEKVRVYDKGEIYDLVREGEDRGLTISWKTREIKGYIADFQIGDAENSGEQDLVLAVVAADEDTGGMFSMKSRSNILFYKLM